jgi:hypothetical protein
MSASADRRGRRRLLVGAAAGFAAACLPTPILAQQHSPVRLRRGINLYPWFSLTNEYPAPSINYAWPPYQQDRPTPTAQDLARLAEVGFDFVRIPVDPGPFMAFVGDRRADLLGSLEQAVDQVIAAGLSVVVNIQGNTATHYWRPETLVGSLSAPELPSLLSLVDAVARILGRKDATRIAIEPVNEPPQACGSSDWLTIQDELIATVRSAAPRVTYVATGACGSMIDGLVSLPAQALRKGGPTLFTFHFYEPYLFTHQGATWMGEAIYPTLNGVPWPASEGSLKKTLAAVRSRMRDTDLPSDQADAIFKASEEVLDVYFSADPAKWFVEKYLKQVDDWRIASGLEASDLLMGEFGALRTDSRYHGAAKADRARYVADVRRTAEEFGIAWAFWNLFDGFALTVEGSRRFDPAILEALGLSRS